MKKKKEKGFTLIEILIVMVIVGILGIGIVSLQTIVGETQISVWRNYISVNEANSNISTFVREIRNTRPGDNGAYALEKALDQEFTFYSDVDFDGDTERVRYYLSGTDLVRGIIEPVGVPAAYPSENEKVKKVASSVANEADEPIFFYYNGDWPADTTNNPLDTPTRLSDTKLMKVYLKINPDTDSGNDFILESYVQLRGLKENL